MTAFFIFYDQFSTSFEAWKWIWKVINEWSCHLAFWFVVFFFQSNKCSRFVQFGADQVCHCGSVSCRQKLGKPNKPKTPSSDAALQIVASQVAMNSSKAKDILHKKDVSNYCYPIFKMLIKSKYPIVLFSLRENILP